MSNHKRDERNALAMPLGAPVSGVRRVSDRRTWLGAAGKSLVGIRLAGMVAAGGLWGGTNLLSQATAAQPEDNPGVLAIRQAALGGTKWLIQHRLARGGGFTYGWLPALDRPMPGNHPLRQAGAAAALARAATFFADERITKSAREVVGDLVHRWTRPDQRHPERRVPILPGDEANPVGLAGLLLLAIAELPDPPPAFTEYGEGLARFLLSRQRPDGSLNLGASLHDHADQGEGADDSPEAVPYYPGEALYALMRASRRDPQPWKTALVERAFPYYRQFWREQGQPAMVPWLTGALAELYRISPSRFHANFIHEMNEVVLGMQYAEADPRVEKDSTWVGGFAAFHRGIVVAAPPGITTASYLEGLVDAWNVARRAGESERVEKYASALQQGFTFLLGLQYDTRNTGHFVPRLSARLLGAFRAGLDDGQVRVDFTQHAISALLLFLMSKAEVLP